MEDLAFAWLLLSAKRGLQSLMCTSSRLHLHRQYHTFCALNYSCSPTVLSD